MGRYSLPYSPDSRNGEFRPNIFRGALRGHALRIFGGLTEEKNAQNLVNILFGGIEGEAQQGLLGLAFQESSLDLGTFSDRKLDNIPGFLDDVRNAATTWMQYRGIQPTSDNYAPWREVWHPDRVQVWGRLAEAADDCKAIAWLHQAYQKGDRPLPQLTIKSSSLTGKINQVGKICHGMYPVIKSKTGQYLEILTIFRDDCPEYQQFINFLQERKVFQLLWGKIP